MGIKKSFICFAAFSTMIFFITLYYQLAGFNAFEFLAKTGTFLGAIGAVGILLVALNKIPRELELFRKYEREKLKNELSLRRIVQKEEAAKKCISLLLKARKELSSSTDWLGVSMVYCFHDFYNTYMPAFKAQYKDLAKYRMDCLKKASEHLEDILDEIAAYSINCKEDVYELVSTIEDLHSSISYALWFCSGEKSPGAFTVKGWSNNSNVDLSEYKDRDVFDKKNLSHIKIIFEHRDEKSLREAYSEDDENSDLKDEFFSYESYQIEQLTTAKKIESEFEQLYVKTRPELFSKIQKIHGYLSSTVEHKSALDQN